MNSIFESRLVDRIFKFLVVLPMVAFWRGIWDLYSYYFSGLPQPLNCWAIVAVSSIFSLSYFLYPLIHKVSKRFSSFKKSIITKITLFVGSIFLMGYWRGVWAVADYYLKDFGYQGCLFLFLLNYTGLTLLATSRSLIFPPFIVSMDKRPDALVPSTAFQIKPEKTVRSCVLYVLDSLFTHFIVLTMNILTWNGGLSFFDHLQPSTLGRNMDYFFLGTALCITFYALESPICIIASKLTNVNFTSIYFEKSFYNLVISYNDNSEKLSQNLESGEKVINKPYLDFKYVDQLDADKHLKSQLHLNLNEEKLDDKDNTKNIQNGCNNNFQKSLLHPKSSHKLLSQQEAVDSNIQQNVPQNQIQFCQIDVQQNKLLPQEKSFKTSDKLKAIIFEDVLGFFILLSLMLMWLGLWEINIELFKFGEPIDAWINFIAGSLVLFAAGLVSFGGACGCAHDLPSFSTFSSIHPSLSSSIHPSINPTNA